MRPVDIFLVSLLFAGILWNVRLWWVARRALRSLRPISDEEARQILGDEAYEKAILELRGQP